MNLEEKYPKASRFLREHPGMSVDQAIEYLEKTYEER